ncbi:MAG: cell division protein FtsL [Clostridia bacterium]|nr:cell division protein FtsL [Clostridia bacterium]
MKKTDWKKRIAKRWKAKRVSATLLAAVLLLVGLVCYQIYCNAQYNELTTQVSNLKEEHADLVNEKIQLGVKIDAMAQLDNIEQIAQEMGMSKIQQHQIEYVNLGSEDHAEVIRVDDGFGGLFRNFSMIWEYLG